MAILEVLVSLCTGIFVFSAAVLWHRPKVRLRHRVDQYVAPALSRLGRPVPDVPVLAPVTSKTVRSRIVGFVDHVGDSPALRRRLIHSGRFGSNADLVVGELRIRQVAYGFAAGGVALMLTVASGARPVVVLIMVGAAVASGVLRPIARSDRDVARRCARLRAELPPMCQLLAVRLRANSSVVAALTQMLESSRGVFAAELSAALMQHRQGQKLAAALRSAAELTPEPEAARVHRLLAGAIDHGIDAAPELLRLARTTRTSHVMALKRDATARRGAVLLPTVGLLAPQIMLFIAAPLPSMVLGSW